MRRTMTIVALVAASLAGCTAAPEDGPVGRACLAGGRTTSRALCGCIQSVASARLSASDQRLAATFFKDPHRAQVVRQSGRNSAFWERYKSFGSQAEARCTG